MEDCNRNTGYRNTGDMNTGDWNTGHRNTGKWNTGDWNTGHRNTGKWNTGDWNTGYLCTDTPKVRIFNKETEVPREDLYFPDWMYFEVVQWVWSNDMTEAEKEAHPEHETTGGYLKELHYKEAAQASYNKATKEDQDKVEQLPNYDPEILFEIFGIDRRPKSQDSCDGKTVEIDGKKYRLTELK